VHSNVPGENAKTAGRGQEEGERTMREAAKKTKEHEEIPAGIGGLGRG